MRNILFLRLLSVMFFTFSAYMAYGQPGVTGSKSTVPGAGSMGLAPLRNEFISYDTRKASQIGDRNATEYYVPLPLDNSSGRDERVFSNTVDLPFVWVDRDLFLHVEGFADFHVEINGRSVAYSHDSRTPSEFMISPYVTDGQNRITIRVPDSGAGRELETDIGLDTMGCSLFLYSQPKVRIEDYIVRTVPDSSGRHMVFDLDVAVSNSYNSAERFMVGFDIYSPEGKLETYDIHEVMVEGGGRDTVRFRELIYHAMKKLWTPESPKLYKITVFVRRDGRIVEYVPFSVGFGSVGHKDGGLTRNGLRQQLDAVSYYGHISEGLASADLKGLKARGVNTVWLSHPQPYWFYNICDNLGMNVVDQANINFMPAAGVTLSNDPAWEAYFTQRILAMYHRNRAHACIVGFSLGGSVGNGYNMYKGYQTLKATGTTKAVLFRDGEGYWNNDADIELRSAGEVLQTPLPAKQPTRRGR